MAAAATTETKDLAAAAAVAARTAAAMAVLAAAAVARAMLDAAVVAAPRWLPTIPIRHAPWPRDVRRAAIPWFTSVAMPAASMNLPQVRPPVAPRILTTRLAVRVTSWPATRETSVLNQDWWRITPFRRFTGPAASHATSACKRLALCFSGEVSTVGEGTWRVPVRRPLQFSRISLFVEDSRRHIDRPARRHPGVFHA
jgi:hypothetical protein